MFRDVNRDRSFTFAKKIRNKITHIEKEMASKKMFLTNEERKKIDDKKRPDQ